MDDPFALFDAWMREAAAAEPNDPNAMALATVDAAGAPNVRVVLLKDVSAGGFVFYTNTQSTKGTELAASPRAAANFHWKMLGRQVRIRGAVLPVSPDEADAYFASRARGSQLGAWASRQSRPLSGRHELEAAVELAGERFPQAVPRPPHWSGYRLTPDSIEFWRDQPSRLHERQIFTRFERGWAVTFAWP